MANRIKIISCPKGGKVPEGYCLKSCLNYSGKTKRSSKKKAAVTENKEAGK